MSVTQTQIAQKLGISAVAVSHALRGTNQVSAATRKRVARAAMQMGYRVNASARATATGRFGAVAFVRSTVEARSWYPGELVDGIEDALESRGLRLTMARLSDDQLTDPARLPAVFREHCVDGLLINYINRIPPQMGELLDGLALPHVWINVDRAHDCVRFDDAAAVRQAVAKLREQGHRRIAYLHYRNNPGGPEHYSQPLRREAYAAAMTDAGLEPVVLSDPRWMPEGEMPALTLAHFRRFEASHRPTAVIAYSQPEAGLAFIAAAALGLSVPRDLSVVSIGDAGDLFWVGSVTCARRSDDAIGEAAVDMLNARLADPDQQQPARLITPAWEPGQTVCPPVPNA